MSKLSRRQLLVAGSGTLAMPFISRAAFAGGSSIITSAQARFLPVPALLQPENGDTVTLAMAMARHNFGPGDKTALSAGLNAEYLAPTVHLTKGTDINFKVQNRLGDVTTLHWHGLFVPSVKDGGPHNTIKDGEDWNIKVHIDQPSSTNWFHPHVHQNTAYQAHLGLAGLMIVDDGKDRERGLPRTYGVDDIPLVLQDRRVVEGDNVYAPDGMDLIHGFHGDKLIVNGVMEPQHEVPAGIMRLRLLNGANARIFNLSFEDRRPFHVIASDGGYLEKPVETGILPIGPGERYEVLVDFSKGKTPVTLFTSSDDNGGGEALPLMLFTSHGRKSEITTIPATFDTLSPANSGMAEETRSFFMDDRMMENMQVLMKGMGGGSHGMTHGGGHDGMVHSGRSTEQAGPPMTAASSGMAMAIAGETFDMNRIDVKARLGSYEMWSLTTSGEMQHPFHIHGASFRVLSLDGKAPPAWATGWKDTVLVNETADLLVHFNRQADEKHPFMFHCHTLEHEDLGMMGQFITV
ncbi:MAG: Multicopper oxidase type 3 (precursor) [Candidatus Tokpelaia hoelldobleri]|uniref:Multicopper oxidase CueO n=1 Tax=Candidatus Tokpelaia hoelldobleri TaxID=1902579 RepID=A0A1U9JUP6_9HYPH|nr:MAG: Multicopper oxidase type 3 (precursor) [Candidatus Tokpelaia hoelldoblerii]